MNNPRGPGAPENAAPVSPPAAPPAAPRQAGRMRFNFGASPPALIITGPLPPRAARRAGFAARAGAPARAR
ncbi:MAG: hypothetical protein LBO76_08120, partial [Treponema sp.]|nr:hypothetical protein [Treponema sp.]